MAETSIEWTRGDDGKAGRVWNACRGCSRISSGCGGSDGGGCYAERMAHRFSGPGMPYEGLTRLTNGGPRWTGKVVLVPEKLGEPLRWRAPARIFANSMSDMFHGALSNEEIAAMFGVMAACPRHTFQCLTKRAKRMREWFKWVAEYKAEPSAGFCMNVASLLGAEGMPLYHENIPEWPLPNVHLGVSCENQETADDRIPHLLATPAAVRWISAEPLLGPLNLHPFLWAHHSTLVEVENAATLDWVVVGGESGPGARGCDVRWIRKVLADCKLALVPVFCKQLGAKPYQSPQHDGATGYEIGFIDRKGGDMAEWPEDLRVREYPR